MYNLKILFLICQILKKAFQLKFYSLQNMENMQTPCSGECKIES